MLALLKANWNGPRRPAPFDSKQSLTQRFVRPEAGRKRSPVALSPRSASRHQLPLECGTAEYRAADHQRMKNKAEQQIEHRSHYNSDNIVAPSACRNRRCAGIGAVFEAHTIVYRPKKKRAEQDDGAEIAVGKEVRGRPSLDADQHGVLERAPDIAADVSRDHKYTRWPHEQLGNVIAPVRRIPHVHTPGPTILTEAKANEHHTNDRQNRDRAFVGPLAYRLNQNHARPAQRHKHMRADEQHEPEDKESHARERSAILSPWKRCVSQTRY